MKVQVEISILEKSILIGMIENVVKEYNKGFADAPAFQKNTFLKILSAELERIKDLNLISFYGVSSIVSMEQSFPEGGKVEHIKEVSE